jgi:GT2 family glycosyltransferase
MADPDSGRPRLSLVILNYNSGPLLRACLDSLFAGGLPDDAEVLVPDNASSDDSLALAVEKWGEQVRVLPTGANGGFAWGNNVGIRASRGEYVCLLNPDTVVQPGALAELVSFMDAHPRAGFAGPKVLNLDGTLQASAKSAIATPFDFLCRALLLGKLFPRCKRLAHYTLAHLDPDATQPVDASAGCCIFARRATLDEIGLLDEGYFMYWEETDWFLRARAAGWEVWYVPTAVIEHHERYGERFRRSQSVRDFHRSMLRFYRKHFAPRFWPPVNWVMYGTIWLRMVVVLCARSLKRWR